MKIVFFGTPVFSVLTLQKLVGAGIKPIAIVTAPDRPKGRGHKRASPPVKIFADDRGIPVFQPEKLDEDFRFRISDFKPDMFVVASYGKILPISLLNIPPKGALNAHPSLLPQYRGASPIQTALLNGDEKTGVTLILMDEKMDHGPILAQQELNVSISQYQFPDLHNKLAELSGSLLIETLPKWLAGEITPRSQEHEKATFTKLFTKEDGRITWQKPAVEIDRMARALNPWPGTWCYANEKRIKILSGRASAEPCSEKPGTAIKKDGALAVCTSDGIYTVEKLQMEGNKPISGPEFLRRYPEQHFFD
jgi:methionyl-tRNA formyltransferase